MYHFIIFDLLLVFDFIFFYNIEAKQVAENIIVRAGKQIAGGKPRVDLLKEKSRQRSRKIRDHDIVNGEDEMCPVYVTTKIIDLEWVYIDNPRFSHPVGLSVKTQCGLCIFEFLSFIEKMKNLFLFESLDKKNKKTKSKKNIQKKKK